MDENMIKNMNENIAIIAAEIKSFLAHLLANGIVVRLNHADNSSLKVQYPEGSGGLDPDFKMAIMKRKPELVAYLRRYEWRIGPVEHRPACRACPEAFIGRHHPMDTFEQALCCAAEMPQSEVPKCPLGKWFVIGPLLDTPATMVTPTGDTVQAKDGPTGNCSTCKAAADYWKGPGKWCFAYALFEGKSGKPTPCGEASRTCRCESPTT